MKKMLLVLLFALVSNASLAAGSKAIFSCKTPTGKQIKVIEVGKNYQYSFGRVGNPELVFQNTKQKVLEQTENWDGKNLYIWDVIKMENGGVDYVVYNLIGTWQGEELNQKGVLVISGDDEVYVRCAK